MNHRPRLTSSILCGCLWLVFCAGPAQASDFWRLDPHSEVYRPRIPCDASIFHKPHPWGWNNGGFHQAVPMQVGVYGVNSTCARPIFHKSHFWPYWTDGDAPTYRSPILHKGCWKCMKSQR